MRDYLKRIGEFLDRLADLSVAWLPPPKPIGWRVRGYDVTQLDLAIAGITVLAGIACSIYLANWWWLLTVILAVIGAILWYG